MLSRGGHRGWAVARAATMAVCLTLSVACATMGAGGGDGAEFITISFLMEEGEFAWRVGHNDENPAQRVQEWVRPGQTVEAWTELITIQTFNKAFEVGSVDEQMSAATQAIAQDCPGSSFETLNRFADGVLYEARVVNCPEGADEHIVARVIDGQDNRFVVQYSVREAVTMTDDRRTEWIDKLSAIRLVRMPE